MKNNKVFKTLDWVYLYFSYIPAILLLIGLPIYEFAPAYSEIAKGFCIAGLIFFIINFVFMFPMFVIGGAGGATSKDPMSKHVMEIKLASIPFFLISLFNGVLAIILCVSASGYLSIPLAVLSFAFMYLTMLRTSIIDIAYFAKQFATKKIKLNPMAIFCIVGLFFLVFDVPAAIILYRNDYKYNADTSEKYREEMLKKVEAYKNKKGLSYKTYKLLTILASALMYVVSIVTLVTFISQMTSDSEITTAIDALLSKDWYITCLCISIFMPLFKVIIGIIYGFEGKENPNKFTAVLMTIDLPLEFILWAQGIMCFVYAAMVAAVGIWLYVSFFIFFLIFFFLSIFIFFAALFSILSLVMVGSGFMFNANLTFFGDSITLFIYYLNQRKMTNRKFASNKVVVYLVMLWIPIIDIIGVFLLNNLNNNNMIFGNEPLFKATPVIDTQKVQ